MHSVSGMFSYELSKGTVTVSLLAHFPRRRLLGGYRR